MLPTRVDNNTGRGVYTPYKTLALEEVYNVICSCNKASKANKYQH